MEKRLQELEKMGKNLCTERMEGEINTETERTSTTTCDNDQSTSCDVDPLLMDIPHHMLMMVSRR